jgi:hypothetical protein
MKSTYFREYEISYVESLIKQISIMQDKIKVLKDKLKDTEGALKIMCEQS